jgi:hypothetical protein
MKQADIIQIKNGSHYGEIGTILKLGWKNIFKVHFEVTDVVDTETYKRITFYTRKVKPYDLKYTLNFTFYWNSVESSTLFVHEMIFDNPESMKVIDLNHDKKEKLEMFQAIEKILKQRTEDIVQLETILIRKNIKEVWETILDWNKFKALVPMIADSVSYEGPVGQVGSLIHCKDATKKVEFDLKIILCDSSDSDNYQHHLECVGTSLRCPMQKLEFSLVKISVNNTFLEFKHKFKENVTDEHIQTVSKSKVKILTNLKKGLESS